MEIAYLTSCKQHVPPNRLTFFPPPPLHKESWMCLRYCGGSVLHVPPHSLLCPPPTQQRLLEAAGFRNLPELSGEESGLWHNVTALRGAAAQPKPEVKTAQPEAYAFTVFKFVGSVELST